MLLRELECCLQTEFEVVILQGCWFFGYVCTTENYVIGLLLCFIVLMWVLFLIFDSCAGVVCVQQLLDSVVLGIDLVSHDKSPKQQSI